VTLQTNDVLTLSSSINGGTKGDLDLHVVGCWLEGECQKRGEQHAIIDTPQEIELISAPSPPSTWRVVTWVSIRNSHTVQAHVVITLDDADAVSVTLVDLELQPSETLLYDGSQWRVFNGDLYPYIHTV